MDKIAMYKEQIEKTANENLERLQKRRNELSSKVDNYYTNSPTEPHYYEPENPNWIIPAMGTSGLAIVGVAQAQAHLDNMLQNVLNKTKNKLPKVNMLPFYAGGGALGLLAGAGLSAMAKKQNAATKAEYERKSLIYEEALAKHKAQFGEIDDEEEELRDVDDEIYRLTYGDD